MDDSDKKPIIERVFTFIGSAVGFICGLIVAVALVENGNKEQKPTIIVMGLVAPILFFRWAGQSIGEKIQSMMDGGKTKVINQLSEAAVPPTLEPFLNENEASCPSCDGFMREWNGEMRCWECGYTEAESIPEPLPFPEADEIEGESSPKPAEQSRPKLLSDQENHRGDQARSEYIRYLRYVETCSTDHRGESPRSHRPIVPAKTGSSRVPYQPALIPQNNFVFS